MGCVRSGETREEISVIAIKKFVRFSRIGSDLSCVPKASCIASAAARTTSSLFRSVPYCAAFANGHRPFEEWFSIGGTTLRLVETGLVVQRVGSDIHP